MKLKHLLVAFHHAKLLSLQIAQIPLTLYNITHNIVDTPVQVNGSATLMFVKPATIPKVLVLNQENVHARIYAVVQIKFVVMDIAKMHQLLILAPIAYNANKDTFVVEILAWIDALLQFVQLVRLVSKANAVKQLNAPVFHMRGV